MGQETVQGHRIRRDGTVETSGERNTRLSVTFGLQAVGAGLLAAGGLASFFDGMARDPGLYLPLTNYINNSEMARIAATLIEAVGGVFAVAASGGLAWLSSETKIKEREARTTVACFGLNYRPGDNRRKDKELLAAAIARGEISPDSVPQETRAPQ